MSKNRGPHRRLERKYVRLGLAIGVSYVTLLTALIIVVAVVTGAPAAPLVITGIGVPFFGLLGVWLGHKVLRMMAAD